MYGRGLSLMTINVSEPARGWTSKIKKWRQVPVCVNRNRLAVVASRILGTSSAASSSSSSSSSSFGIGPASKKEMLHHLRQLLIMRDFRRQEAVDAHFAGLIKHAAGEAAVQDPLAAYVTVDILSSSRREGFEPIKINVSDLALFLEMPNEAVLEAERTHTLQNLIKGKMSQRFAERQTVFLLHETALSSPHPFSAATSSSAVDVVSIQVKSGEGEEKTLYASMNDFAHYLGFHPSVVRTILTYRTAEELLLRCSATPIEDSGSRLFAILSDIIKDNGDSLSESEVASYRAILPFNYDRANKTICSVDGKAIGSGTYGAVSRWYLECLGNDKRKGVSGMIARKYFKDKNEDKAIQMRNRELQIVQALMAKEVPYVIKAYPTEHPVPYIDFEYCKLGELSAEGVNGWTAVGKWTFFLKLLRGYQAIHEAGYVHFDIKPQNVLIKMVNGEVEPRIIDFTFAEEIGKERTGYGGSPAYVPLEYWDFDKKDVDPSRDAYSAGLLGIEVFMGIEPDWFYESDEYPNEHDIKLGLPELRKKINEEYPSLPQKIRDAVLLLIDSDPSKRSIPTAITLIEEALPDLEAVIAPSLHVSTNDWMAIRKAMVEAQSGTSDSSSANSESSSTSGQSDSDTESTEDSEVTLSTTIAPLTETVDRSPKAFVSRLRTSPAFVIE